MGWFSLAFALVAWAATIVQVLIERSGQRSRARYLAEWKASNDEFLRRMMEIGVELAAKQEAR